VVRSGGFFFGELKTRSLFRRRDLAGIPHGLPVGDVKIRKSPMHLQGQFCTKTSIMYSFIFLGFDASLIVSKMMQGHDSTAKTPLHSSNKREMMSEVSFFLMHQNTTHSECT
jgi:hypothetical protein